MKPITILRRARKKIEDPKHWTRGRLARDKWSHGVEPTDPRAVKWCAIGAVEAVGGSTYGKPPEVHLLKTAAITLNHVSITNLNDHTDHATVLRMFDKAIALAKEEDQ